ncbi:hypothetical protein HanIR_Chr15g0782521 [Helianthus annuus]|nr:hypothetical protein HanIR_Chr15g0782521 [Helianthus annuus]
MIKYIFKLPKSHVILVCIKLNGLRTYKLNKDQRKVQQIYNSFTALYLTKFEFQQKKNISKKIMIIMQVASITKGSGQPELYRNRYTLFWRIAYPLLNRMCSICDMML